MIPGNCTSHVGLNLRVGDRGVWTSPVPDCIAHASAPLWHCPSSSRRRCPSDRSLNTKHLSPWSQTELNTLLLMSRLHNRSGLWQRAWMKHQQNNLWFRCFPNNYTRHKLRVNLSQTNDSWKRKRVSVSISRNDGNGNMFLFPLLFTSSTECIIIVFQRI